MPAVVSRQIRIGIPEHEALNKAAEVGMQTRYIVRALRAALVADGHLPKPEEPALLAKMNGRRPTSAGRHTRKKAAPRRRGRR